MATLTQQTLPSGAETQQDRLKLPGSHKPATLLSGNGEGGLVPMAGQTLMIQPKSSGSMAMSSAPITVLPTKFTAGIREDAAVKPSTIDDITGKTSLAEESEEDEDSWDGQVLTEEELEEFLDMEKPCPVVQVGKDFFDAEGNFLYRI